MRKIEESTGKTPQALLDAPALIGICQEMVSSYNVLASRRTAGLTANPISLMEIESFIRLYGPPSIPVGIFIDLIGVMDNKFLELNQSKSSGHNSTSSR